MSSSNKESASDLIRAKDAGLLDIWALPSFDPHVEPEPEPEPSSSTNRPRWKKCRWMKSSH